MTNSELELLVDENNRKLASLSTQGAQIAPASIDNLRILTYLRVLLGDRETEAETAMQRALRDLLSAAESQVARAKLGIR